MCENVNDYNKAQSLLFKEHTFLEQFTGRQGGKKKRLGGRVRKVLYGTSIEMLARSVPGVEDIVAQKSLLRIQDWRPMGKSRLGISGSSAGVKSLR